VNKVEVL